VRYVTFGLFTPQFTFAVVINVYTGVDCDGQCFNVAEG
jgi:hypothetical protein